ncbi:MAG: KilA-N domain-containing protein [Anaerovoracaceae bacterium]
MKDGYIVPYISLTEIAREKKISSPSYTIQSWLHSHTTTEFLRTWEKKVNPKFNEDGCNRLIETVHKTGTTMTPTLWVNMTQAMGLFQLVVRAEER